MNNSLAKKIIIIGSIVLVIAVGAIVLALTVGNKTIPSLGEPNEVFYERLDNEGNVIYTITNEEIYEYIKANNGIQQLLMLVDAELLKEYFENISETEISNKIKLLTYGTEDDDAIAEMDAENKQTMEDEFARSMLLAGYEGNENEYVSLLIAREKYSLKTLTEQITENEVATNFINSYFEDMKAINIRFTSKEDANAVLQKFHLVELYGSTLAQYKGYTYTYESLEDNEDNIVEAYTTVDVLYFDENDNLVDVNKEIIYTKGANDFYTDEDDASFSIDSLGNLINTNEVIVVKKENIFDTFSEAKAYKDANTFYYTMSKIDPYDEDEDILIKNSENEVVYTVKPDKKVFDASNTDVTNSHDLIFNKNYKLQKDVSTFTINNTNELTEQEILNYYILMYNYVYGVYRDVLPIESTKEELITLDNSYLSFNFDEEKEKSSTLATYIFETISQLNDKVYSSKPQSISFSSSTFYYMTYKLEEPTKDNLGKTILDLVEQSIQLPQNVVESIELPATGEYGATITWVSADKTVIANDGTVTTPAEDTRVDLSYTIKVLGETRTGKINVNILTEGTNSKIPELTITYPTLKALIDNDDLYNSIRDKIANDKIYGSDANTNVNNQLTALRTEKGFIIYDYYLGIDYKEIDKAYENKNNGNKTLVAKLDSTLTSDEPYEITADDLFNFTITKNPALYTLQTAQFKELLYSEYYEESFGEQKNVLKNDSIRMDEMHAGVTNAKQYYLYMKSMYAQYNMEYPYKSFLDYAYTQYGTKTENALLEYFVATELKPYLINKVLKEIDIVDAMYPIVEDNFDNYFSLDTTHLLVYIDFDEDGNSDNYKDYLSELGTAERDSLNSMLARLETALNAFEEDYEDLVAEYLKASRDDETWGEFKQAGILLLAQDLNTVDEEDSEVTHSLTYSGEYGIKDSYDESFTEALVDLYQEYNLPTNLDLEELESDLIVTNFGLHLILVQKGDDFERLSAKYPASSENADQYDEASYNDSDKPTVEQLELYATYKFYSLIYDLSNADVEEKYGITVPKIPTSVSKALDFYFDEILNQVYVLGTANIEIANLISQGNFLGNEELGLNDSEIKANLVAVKDAYYGAVLSKYFE